MKIELYLVKSCSGSYDDYRESNETIIYATLEAAEKRMNEIIVKNAVQPFPFDWCTEEQFNELRYEDKATEEDLEIIDQWELDNHYAQEFGSAWIQKVELDQQSWRERQLKGLL